MNALVEHIASLLDDLYDRDEAVSLAWWVAEETTGLSHTQLQIGCKDTTFSADMQAAIERLRHFEPIQYIFGHTYWCGLDLKVTPATLIPRPETAELVEKISNFQFPISNCRVLDIGTGSGCIALAIKQQHPDWQVTGIDISAEAIEVARENARRNQLEVEFRVADIFNLQSPISNTISSSPTHRIYVRVREPACAAMCLIMSREQHCLCRMMIRCCSIVI